MTADEQQKAEIERKRQKAVDYLRQRGIYRADLDCRHRYAPCEDKAPEQPPVVTVYCCSSARDPKCPACRLLVSNA